MAECGLALVDVGNGERWKSGAKNSEGKTNNDDYYYYYYCGGGGDGGDTTKFTVVFSYIVL